MSKTYVAVQRTGQNDNELTHWKYIKRVKKPNGKYRYYYDKESLKADVKDKWNKDITGKDYLRITIDGDRHRDMLQEEYDYLKEYKNDPEIYQDNLSKLLRGTKIRILNKDVEIMEAQIKYLDTLAGKGEKFVRNMRTKFDKNYDEAYSDWLDRITGVD